MNLVYLAVPYSNPDLMVRQYRFEQVTYAAGTLIEHGFMVFSPITHSHSIAKVAKLPKDFAFWEEFDTRMMKACDQLMILTLDGWEESVGIQNEIIIAKKLGFTWSLLEPKQRQDWPVYRKENEQ